MRRHTFRSALSRPAVLVVEDEVLARVVLADDLREGGCDVAEAADADEALRMFRTGADIDVLVTDICMPGSIDGAELAKVVRRRFPEVKIIVVSAERPIDDLLNLADGYFEKPYVAARLRECVAAMTPATRTTAWPPATA